MTKYKLRKAIKLFFADKLWGNCLVDFVFDKEVHDSVYIIFIETVSEIKNLVFHI